MRGFIALLALAGALADPLTIQTKNGVVVGKYSDSGAVREWQGVPFAAPPVGELRWKAPQPVQNWDKPLTTQWYGNSCMQGSDAFTILTKISEDCLYLNIYAPANTTKTDLPVMIFFYGGSWKYGSAGIIYDGSEDILINEDVILITTNYRLGVFGFLGSDALRTRDPSGSTGNYGIQDQRAAIQWVHDNIAAFGGNPDLITIFGESAGAGSVSTHLVAPRSKGMFQRAIMESGPLAQWVGMPYHYSQVKYQQVLEYVGCNSSSVTAQLSCLEGVDANTLQSSEGHIMDGLLQWAPVIDGVELTDLPENLAAEGKFANRVPVLMGTNRDEGTLFVHGLSKSASASDFKSWLTSRWGETNGTLVYNQYDPSNYPSPWWALTHVIGDAAMSCAARRSGRWLNAAGTGPVYIYFFQHELEVIKLFVPDYGVCHGSDIAMVFNLKVGLWGKGEETLAQQFGKYWTTFAKNGDPNSAATPEWAPYDSETDNYQVLDIPISNTTALKKEVCDFWDQMPVSETFIWADHNVPTMPGLFLEALRRLSRP